MSDVLGEFEQLVLLAVLRLGDEAYGAAIGRELREKAGRDPSPGAIFTTLERLEARGLVRSRYGEPTPERGGRRKRYYRLRSAGQRALARSYGATIRMARGLEGKLTRS
jgi:DNA-binding PadR family transcriptional regulator